MNPTLETVHAPVGDAQPVPITPSVLPARARLVPLLAPHNQTEADVRHERIEALRVAAARDGHIVIAPTHLMVRGEKINGYLSLGGLLTVQAWFDTQSTHALDSLKMIEQGEAVVASQGVRAYAVAVTEDSPFAPHMARLGYECMGPVVLWHKTLT